MPNRGDWLLRSKTTRPAFSRCRPAATVRRAVCRCEYGPAHRLSRSRPADRKPDSGKFCIARGTSISQFSIARSASLWPNTNRWFFGKASTRSSRLCHLTPKNNRESYSRSKRKQDSSKDLGPSQLHSSHASSKGLKGQRPKGSRSVARLHDSGSLCLDRLHQSTH